MPVASRTHDSPALLRSPDSLAEGLYVLIMKERECKRMYPESPNRKLLEDVVFGGLKLQFRNP